MKLAASLVAVAWSGGPAAAERAISVELTAPAVFDAGELREAMRVRMPADGAAVAIRVTPTPEGVRIETRRKVRMVDVAGLHGTAAARLVALAADDLLLDDLATLPVTRSHESLTIGASAGIAGWANVLAGGGVDLAVPLGRGLLAIELGAGSLTGGPVELTAATARFGPGVRLGIVELRGGVVLAPIFVASGGGDSTVLAGATASIRLRIPVAPRVHAVFAAGADVFATRTEYRIDGMAALTTPQLAPWLGAGMELSP
ncbi:MAG: hypothetical protein ABI867_24175 [Kofleriaceae bacterium]